MAGASRSRYRTIMRCRSLVVLALASIPTLACSSSAPTTTDAPASSPSATSPEPAPSAEAPSTAAFTEAEVQGLFDVKCVRCHAKNNDLLDLSSFPAATIGVPVAGGREECAGSRHRLRIAPGDHQASLLWHKANGSHDCGDVMPPPGRSGRLTAKELERLAAFIDALPR